MYDAIIIGSRCAGAATALQLARRGRRVLVLDRSVFPSDVLSGHTIQPAGLGHLARWGLLERIRATGVPFASQVRFDFGDIVLRGAPVPFEGIDSAVCIRRTVIDGLLADAAQEAGAELRLGHSVTELVRDGDRVVGVQGHDGSGRPFEARAGIVVGADGARSFVARAVAAPAYLVQPASSITVYSYWRDVDLDGIELYARPGRFFIAAPTNDALSFVAQQVPVAEDGRYRSRVEAAFAETLAAVPHLAERVASGERAERFRFAHIEDSFFRHPYGPGWALVGDAGYHKDPITAQGMLDAFRHAELLAEAIDSGLDGSLSEALERYRRARDTAAMPMYELTCRLADLETPPPAEMFELLAALQGQPAHIARFLGVIAGSVAVDDFYGPASVAAVMVGAATAA
jgi:flavin-dependent dehydrogenase